jgi:hypothetical protein
MDLNQIPLRNVNAYKNPIWSPRKASKSYSSKKKKASKSEVHKTSNLSLALLLLSKAWKKVNWAIEFELLFGSGGPVELLSNEGTFEVSGFFLPLWYFAHFLGNQTGF